MNAIYDAFEKFLNQGFWKIKIIEQESVFKGSQSAVWIMSCL